MGFIFDPSLVLYLPLYELDGGSFMSKDAYGHLCTVTGAAWRPNGRYFDGLDNYISCGDKDIFSFTDGAGTDKAFSILQWICQADNTDIQCPISKYKGTATSECEFQLRLDTGKPVVYFCHSDNVGHRIGRKYDTAILTNTWYLVGITYSGSESESGIKIYLNAAQVDDTAYSAGTYTGMIDTTAPLEMGRRGDGVMYFTGLQSELWVFRRELSPQECQGIYIATKWRYR